MKNKKINLLFIGGTFDDVNGKPSKVMDLILKVFKQEDFESITCCNGGSFKVLEDIFENIQFYNIILWFANVSNNKKKLVNEIKQKNPHCLLVTSKRNTLNEYSLSEITQRALKIKSNLFIEITKQDQRFRGRVIDPLGNIFCDYEDDFFKIGQVLLKRIKEILSFTRIGSHSLGKDLKEIPDEKEFFEIIKKYGEIFHVLIHGMGQTNRFLGNASFRCEKGGFPSFKVDNDIYVSKRNIDKQFIDKNGFVRVPLNQNGDILYYYGDHKPSVDTPIQLKLFKYYVNVNYILHSHTYVKDYPKTTRVIPCGAIEEFKEIRELYPNNTHYNFSVNLRGHGSITLAHSLDYFNRIEFIERDLFEVHNKGCEM